MMAGAGQKRRQNQNGVDTVKKYLIAALILAVIALDAYAGQREREQNKYKTHKLSLNAVLISCNDEREPVVKKIDGPFVIVACETR